MALPSRRRAAWPLLALSGLSLVVAWALASPVGASPDEPAHIWYAWGTVTGQTLGGEHLVNKPVAGATAVRLPQTLLQHIDPICYMFKQSKPVTTCMTVPPDNAQIVIKNSYMSRYPPLFYGVEGVVLRAGVAAGLSGPQVLYGARLAAAILSLFVIAYGVFLLSWRFSARVVLLATLLGLPATAWFLAGSVNPNGLEVTAAFLLAAAVLSVRADLVAGVRSVAAILAVPLGTLLLAWTRPVSWVWAALILGLLLVPTSQPDAGSWSRRLPLRRLGATATAVTVLVLASSMAWFAYAIQIRSTEAGPTANLKLWDGLNPVERVILLVLRMGAVVTDQIGNFGWTDTPLPTLAVVAWVSVAAVAIAAWGMGRSALMPRWPLGLFLGLGCLAFMLDEYRGAWGWQGRYILPITAALCVFAIPGLVKGLEGWKVSRRVVDGMLFVLMAVNALSVVWFLFRNAYGLTDLTYRRLPPAPLPVGIPSWIPPLGVGAVLSLALLAFACGVVGIWALRFESGNAQDKRLVVPATKVDAQLGSPGL